MRNNARTTLSLERIPTRPANSAAPA